MRDPDGPGRRAAAPAAAALLLALALLSAPPGAAGDECRRWRAAFAAMPVRTIAIERDGQRTPLTVKVAETGEQQAAGFQCATADEIDRHLILFDFGREIYTRFHMNNVPAPLDIAFVKADGRIFSILRMHPSPTELYGPMGPFRFALEARQGFYASRDIRAGAARLLPRPDQ